MINKTSLIDNGKMKAGMRVSEGRLQAISRRASKGKAGWINSIEQKMIDMAVL